MSIITKEELKKIVELSESVPEQYRNVCFEILLKQKLQGIVKPAEKEIDKNELTEKGEKGVEKKFIVPIDV